MLWTIFSLLSSQGDCVHWIAYSFWLPKNQVSILILFNMKTDFNNPSHEVLLTCLLIILLYFLFSYGSYSRSQKILWNYCSKVAAEVVPWNPALPICLTFTWPPSSVIQIAEGLERQHLCNRSCKSSYEYACVLVVTTLLLFFCCEYTMCISYLRMDIISTLIWSMQYIWKIIWLPFYILFILFLIFIHNH